MSKVRKIAVLLVVIAGLASQQIACTERDPLTTPSQPADDVIAPDLLREDLAVLYDTIRQSHPNMYAYVSEAEVSRIWTRTIAAVDRHMTKKEFYWLAAPSVAALQNGHTFLAPPYQDFAQYLDRGGKCFVVPFRCSETGVVLGRGMLDSLPVGARVITTNGEDASVFVQRVARCVASERQAANFVVPFHRSMAMWFWLAGYDTSTPLKLQVRTSDGEQRECEVRAVNKVDILAKKQQKPQPANYAFRMLPEHNAGLLEFNLCMEDDQRPFREFLAEAFRALHERRAGDLIIDIRSNPGGDSWLGDLLMSYLTDKPFSQADVEKIRISPLLREVAGDQMEVIEREYLDGKKPQNGEVCTVRPSPTKPQPVEWSYRGRVYLLIGQANYSSAAMLASAMKHYGLATLIGEETGESTAQYGNILSFTLPNTGLQAGVAAKYFVMAGGSEDGRGVIPHYEVGLSLEDRVSDRDMVMESVMTMIGQHSPLKDKGTSQRLQSLLRILSSANRQTTDS